MVPLPGSWCCFLVLVMVNFQVSVLASKSIPSIQGLDDLIEYLDDEMKNESTINVGNGSQVDKEVQIYLAQAGYKNVIVHSVQSIEDVLEHNDDWVYKPHDNYNQRDKYMCSTNRLIAVWDGFSFHTKRNIDKFDIKDVRLVCLGVYISCNTKGIGAALSINDRKAKSLGNIKLSYPTNFKGQVYDYCIDIWKDNNIYQKYFEQYQNETDAKIRLMIDILTEKFTSNPDFWDKVSFRGGVHYLSRCSLSTNNDLWDGHGLDSLYISCLIKAFNEAGNLLMF